MKIALVAFFAVLAFSPIAKSVAADNDQERPYTIKRQFVDGAFGQVHLRIARPLGKATHLPLVLFHASPYSGDYFLPFIDKMATDRIVIAMDTPGYGDSAPPPSPPTIAEYAASAARALDALDDELLMGEPVDILGYHTGALIAAELAIIDRARIRRLVLPGVPFLTSDAQRAAYEEYVKPEALSADGSHLTNKWAFATYAMPAGVSLERAQEHFNDMMQCEPRCWWSYHGVFSYAGERRLPDVEQPVLLISYDGSLSDETKAAHDVFRHAKHIHISGVTRGAFDVAADKLAKETRQFLDDAPSGGE